MSKDIEVLKSINQVFYQTINNEVDNYRSITDELGLDTNIGRSVYNIALNAKLLVDINGRLIEMLEREA